MRKKLLLILCIFSITFIYNQLNLPVTATEISEVENLNEEAEKEQYMYSCSEQITILPDIATFASFPNKSVEPVNYFTGVSTISELNTRLNTLISKYQNTYWTSTGSACASHSSTCYSKYYHGWQCKGFASYIFNDLFCGGFIGVYDDNMYYIPEPQNATLVGKSWGFSSTDTATVKSILSQGQVGDFIQTRRRDKSYGHSMILAGVNENGVYLFDCNSDGKCGVKYYHQTWETFASKNSGMSLYHSTKYPTGGSSGTTTPTETAEITSVSVSSASSSHITLNFSCSSATKLARVQVTSTTSGEKTITDYTTGLDNAAYTFNTSTMTNPGKTFQIYIYGYLSTSGTGETLHRVTYNADVGYVTLPDAPIQFNIEYEPEKLVTDDPIIGWATASVNNPITQIVCYVNDVAYNCSLATRDDVITAYPDYQTTNQGFKFTISPLYYNNGNAQIRLVAIQQNGEQTEIYNKSITSIKMDESLFDFAWYYANHYLKDSNVANIGVDGLALKEYYYNYGIKKGHSPNICFDPVWYFEKNVDLPRDYTNAEIYEHYINYCLGNNEPRETSCFLDLDTYVDYNEDIANAGYNTMQLTMHYFFYGSKFEFRVAAENAQAYAFLHLYNPQKYASLNSDILSLHGDGTTVTSANGLWDHFWINTIAGGETRKTNTSFDMHFYRYNYNYSSNYEALWYYLNTGYEAGQITIDETAPVISNVKITDITFQGYTVTCTVTDEVAVDRVQFPTWTTKNGQDDLLSDWSTNSAARGTKSGNTYTYQVRIADHNNETGQYSTHIYAYDKYGNYSYYRNVLTVPTDVESIVLDSSELTFIGTGEMKTLTATIIPTDATDKTVVWSTSDEAVATVDNGVVTAVGYGSATITATASNGSTAECSVVVNEPENQGEDVIDVFTDVTEGSWYVDAVQYVYDKGIMSGNNGEFNPKGNITRAQVVATLYKLAGAPAVTDYSACEVFADVEANKWYTDAVCWAYNTGVGTGNLDTKMFNISNSVTRQQLASFFYSYAEYKGLDTSVRADISEMVNADQVSSYATESVEWAVGAGIISGSATTDANGNTVYDLKPKATATRAQMATILMNFCESYNL